jgi:hypothetical protein
MATTAPKIHSSTQKFMEIVDFVGDIVVLEGGNACIIVELTASNFALLSKEEQDMRIVAYAGLLNSLSFPIQIVVRNRRMDISSYIQELDGIIRKTKNQQLVKYISEYQAFIQDMVTVNVVLNKAFYVVIPFSALEAGAKGVAQTQTSQTQIASFAETARKSLHVKATSLLAQLQKFSVTAKILEKEDLVRLFYDLYNEGNKIEAEQMMPGIDAPLVKGEVK